MGTNKLDLKPAGTTANEIGEVFKVKSLTSIPTP